MPRAVVFAYHNVGVRCLRVLLAHGVDVALVVTHTDSPLETIWFDSVAATARECGIDTIAPENANTPDLLARIEALAPEFLFSFYYRSMLAAPLLAVARQGAFNLHGSLLPRYRGRAPVNWAVLHGEQETGATLHCMTTKADAGDIVAQTRVPILPDDTAREVFDKVTVAAEITLDGVLPALIAGTAPRRPQDAASASYFGGRRPEDGIIDWKRDALSIHNLVRAVAPPYPAPAPRSRECRRACCARAWSDRAAPPTSTPAVESPRRKLLARCGGGGTLAVLSLELAGVPCDAAALPRALRRCAGTSRHACGRRPRPRIIRPLPDLRP
jgi:methionyl-tRNA formyltransferase